MKDQILKLRAEGKSYREIEKILGCSKGSVSYHCGLGQKEKSKKRVEKSREKAHPLVRKIEHFKARRSLKGRVESFQKRFPIGDERRRSRKEYIPVGDVGFSFGPKDVLAKFGDNPKCSLSGRRVNWEEVASYSLDHKVPVSKGGDNSLDNLQLLHPQINTAKSDLTDEEFISLCKEILEYQGYEIKLAPKVGPAPTTSVLTAPHSTN